MTAPVSPRMRRALRRTPPHLVLVLHAGCAHLYHGYADTLVPMSGHGFPVEHDVPALDPLESGDDRLERFLDRVDVAFGHARREHPSPMVLAGSWKVVTAFADRSENLYRLAGVVTGSSAETMTGLYAASKNVVEQYLLSREVEALWTLQQAQEARPDTVSFGVAACREAARRCRPVMLALEEGLVGSSPDPVSDSVHDLIDRVMDEGGWVALVRDDALGHGRRIALVSQPRSVQLSGARPDRTRSMNSPTDVPDSKGCRNRPVRTTV